MDAERNLSGDIERILASYKIEIRLDRHVTVGKKELSDAEKALVVSEVLDAIKLHQLVLDDSVATIYFLIIDVRHPSQAEIPHDRNKADLHGEIFFFSTDIGVQKIPYTLPVTRYEAGISDVVEVAHKSLGERLHLARLALIKALPSFLK